MNRNSLHNQFITTTQHRTTESELCNQQNNTGIDTVQSSVQMTPICIYNRVKGKLIDIEG